MAMWGVTCDKGTASVQSVGVLTAAASSPRRGRIISINIGSPDTPADSAFLHVMQRCSTAGTGTAKTPNALDPGDTLACTIVVKDTVTVDPTTTSGAFVDEVPLNQRNSYRWMAKDGSELVIPATASNGFMLGLSAATTTKFSYGINFREE